jgi:hypothetical protein
MRGGGIFDIGALTITDSTIAKNSAADEGGGIFYGGGGNVTMTDSTIANNSAINNGGGIYNFGGTVAMTDITIAQNSAGDGGGIYNFGGALTTTDSTIVNNSATADGGGILSASGGTVTITDATITGNTAPGASGVGGGIDGAATIGATVLARNSATDASTNNCEAPLASVGYNLTDDTTGTACGFTKGTDQVDVDPNLGPLANNGGPTQTMLPAPGSPAIEVIPSPTTLNGVPVCGAGAFDQRGVPRPTPGPRCSVGAVEAATGIAPAITSADSASFIAGTNGTFDVTTSGLPTPTLSVSTGSGQSGLPSGVHFADNGNGTATLAGTATTPGTFTFTITAANGVSLAATQNFTLTVHRSPVPPVAPVPPSLSGGAAVTALPNGAGYWISHPDGGVFSFGSAPFMGSLPGLGIHVTNIVGIATTPDGKGYWMVGSDGGIFTFGDAGFFGSMGGTPLNKPVVAMAADPAGGYWLVASDGGLFNFGGAPFMGSMGGTPLNKPVVGVSPGPGGAGYWMVASDGGVFSFGTRFAGSLGGSGLSIIGLFSISGGNGYTLVEANGTAHTF